jgi:tol-pal system protein YbgF
MSRCRLLSTACPTLLLTVFVLAATAPTARSQDTTTQERLDRIERDLSMLQRQVYSDGVSPGGYSNAPPAGNLAVDTQIRMERLEQQMRDLTGKVEEETNEVQQLRQRLEQINSDIDARFGEQNQGTAHPPRIAAPPSIPGPRREAFAGEGTAEPPAPYASAPPPPYPGMPPPPPYGRSATPGALLPSPDAAGTLTPPADNPPPAAATAAGEGPRPAPATLPPAPASAQYNTAFGLLRRADYQGAEDAFREFVRQHPDSSLAGSAQYWLGESYYVRGRYGDAAVAFAEGYKRYPRGPKASETVLRLAMSLGRAQQKQNACVALAQLDHAFPHAANAIKERAAVEKKRSGC